MKKQQEAQLLFKFLQSNNYSIERKETKLDLDEIQKLNKENVLFELIIEDQDLNLTIPISTQFEQFTQLIYLGLNKCNISKLVNIPLINSLRRLTLDYNYIDNHELKYLSFYNNTLISLSLAENQLDFTIDGWKDQIGGMKQLVQLTISGNKFVQPEEDQNRNDSLKIRNLLFDMLPNLRFLDCIEKGKTQHIISHFKTLKEETEYLARFEFISDQKDTDNSSKNNDNDNDNKNKNDNDKNKNNNVNNNNDNNNDNKNDNDNDNENENDNENDNNQQEDKDNIKQDSNTDKTSDESSAEVKKVIKKKKNQSKGKGKSKGQNKPKKKSKKQDENGQEKIKKQVKIEPQIQEPTRRSSRIRGKNE